MFFTDRKCPEGWVLSDNQVCYLIVNDEQKCWLTASSDCKRAGGSLVLLDNLGKAADLAGVDGGELISNLHCNVVYFSSAGEYFHFRILKYKYCLAITLAYSDKLHSQYNGTSAKKKTRLNVLAWLNSCQ